MTRADRDNLARLARSRGKLAKSGIAARCAALRSDVESQLSANYSFTDERWADITAAARVAVQQAEARVAAACRASGIPEDLAPSLGLSWQGRGENALRSRREELRRLAASRIDEMARAAALRIDEVILDVETQLVRAGLDTDAGAAFLDAMPTPADLLPQIDVAELAPGAEPRDRWRSWEPPAGAAAALLRTGRQGRRDAIAAAIAATPDASDREIGRIAGVDHKTVAAVRGEIPRKSGDFPTDSPTDSPAADAPGGAR